VSDGYCVALLEIDGV